jgi:hypothetical protein
MIFRTVQRCITLATREIPLLGLRNVGFLKVQIGEARREKQQDDARLAQRPIVRNGQAIQIENVIRFFGGYDSIEDGLIVRMNLSIGWHTGPEREDIMGQIARSCFGPRFPGFTAAASTISARSVMLQRV